MLLFLTERRRAWVLLGGCFAVLLVLAALRPLAVPDEGRYGEIGRWMLVSGDWMTPRLNGIPFFHKPPLLHWLDAAALAVLGASPWALRVVPALHALGMLVALYLAARHMAGAATALRAALFLGSSVAFLLGGQYVNHDMLVACWIGVAILCFAASLADAHARPHAGLARWGFVACAFGVLSKMLIAVLLPGAVILLWALWTGRWRRLWQWPWFSGLALFAAIALPWFVAEGLRFPGMFDYLVIGQQFGRYTGTVFNNAQPWWFYLVATPALMLPWAPFALYLAWTQRRAVSRHAANPWPALCWIWLLVIVLFFSIPRSKILGYILPVMPPLALLSAWGWERAFNARPKLGRWLEVAGVALAFGLALLLNQFAARVTAGRGSEDVARVLACRASAADTVYAAGEFPYDLPFYLQTDKPMVVIQDWPALRRNAGDNWRRELFEGADFDTASAAVLQTPDVLARAAHEPGGWLVAARDPKRVADESYIGWVSVYQGQAWTLYASAAKRPETTERVGLKGCKDHRTEQRQP